jgi:glycogen synthase
VGRGARVNIQAATAMSARRDRRHPSAAPPLKIAFISGPANVREIYRQWSGQDEQAYFGTDYMKQFLQVATDAGAQSYVVTWHGDSAETFELGDFMVDNRPGTRSGGLGYYLGQLAWHLRVLAKLIAFRPDVLLLTGNQNFWWLLSPIRLLRPTILISYHAVLWPKFGHVPFTWRASLQLNRLLILRHSSAIVLTSNDIVRQVREILGKDASKVEILHHLPTYARSQFAGLKAPERHPGSAFRVNFTGRIVKNKGVYDVVEIGRQLHETHPGKFRFDICGDGEELPAVRRLVTKLGLEDVVLCHGFCDTRKLQALLAASHASVVPTRMDCEAGFEMTCAEAILAGRPLITSGVCPALEYVAEAAIEVPPEDVDAYRDAILELSEDAGLYERKREACAALQEQFYDGANSWYAAMMRALEHHAGAAVAAAR